MGWETIFAENKGEEYDSRFNFILNDLLYSHKHLCNHFWWFFDVTTSDLQLELGTCISKIHYLVPNPCNEQFKFKYNTKFPGLRYMTCPVAPYKKSVVSTIKKHTRVVFWMY